MSLLASLVRAYDRLPDAPPYGYSAEKIGFCVLLNPDGSVAGVADLRGDDKKRSPRVLLVPQPPIRTSGKKACFLWDKTAYCLGVTAGNASRAQEEHALFVADHERWLADADDAGLRAFLAFLRTWTPDRFGPPDWDQDLVDQNAVFALAGQHRAGFIHDRQAAKAIWQRIGGERQGRQGACLVSGDMAPIADLHPKIKGVWGAQSAGASLVSFNAEAYESYGHESGDNAPVSQAAAFAYTTVLNRYLTTGSGHRVQIGDASTVFWADCSDAEVAEEAEFWGGAMFGEPSKAGTAEDMAERKIQDKLRAIAAGRPLREVAPQLAEGVRFFIAGLAPNAARVSLRFYWEGSFGTLAQHYAAYSQDVAIEPAPQRRPVSIRAATLRTAPAELHNGTVRYDGERVSRLLAGELLRAIITGGRFPRALLALLVLRIRSDQVLDPIRLALIKGLIVRDMRLDGRLPRRADGTEQGDYLMCADPDDPNVARRLGRLFALFEKAQMAALGDGINSTVKDKFLGAAAATPGRVFPALCIAAENHHLKRLRNGHSDARWIKDADHARRVAAGLGREIGALWASFAEGLPAQHSAEDQGLFLIGYYQERYARRDAAEPGHGSDPDTTLQEQDE
ncbi:type I-C CRISPR-associated protein Cas8c/Csd1 [Paracoccus contaminans]|uniref:Type I-C CRISPR-associated protein Cas8c/Csd1 n=1 Tax=Paracoccus contaminans TaxID=1945662 RepID=A0A1W6CY25_9RHOB|nr:type I-C CRISPR-associated protein Cas8c/Csd1 [Paracoccus contaminans]ARJ69745.1 type I-C CRISPR-associated protein Cas8c/Csd1 [Paracoccus contaminans]